MQQKKYKTYAELAKGRQPFLLYKTDTKMHTEYVHQKEINDKLQNIAENLMSDFPLHFYTFQRMANTLKLSVVVM